MWALTKLANVLWVWSSIAPFDRSPTFSNSQSSWPLSSSPRTEPVDIDVSFHESKGHGVAWAKAFAKAHTMVANMTLEEKVNITTAVSGPCQANSGGVHRLGFPGLCFNDGPAGPRYTDFVTQFPSEFSSIASFDRDLMEERARRIGNEFRGKGINVALGPVTGGPLGRTPFGGRNWESFTPDPYLSSTISFLTIKAMQESGLITSAKHYILYEQQEVCNGGIGDNHERLGCKDPSMHLDDKTMKELYLPSFAEAVRAGTGSVMCSYNLINGTYTCENDVAMHQILKNELNFQGFILSDFGGIHSTVSSANSGMDLELPFEMYYGKELLKAVQRGDVNVSRMDDMATRILTTWIAAGQAEDYPKINYYAMDLRDEIVKDSIKYYNKHVNNKGDNHLFARKVAAESTVLLKNKGVLPLKDVRRLGVFGSDAAYPSTISGCGPDLFCTIASERRYWNGTVTVGGGSGAIYPDYIAAPIEAITLRARKEGIRVDHVLHDDGAHFRMMDWIASQSEVCLVFVSVFLVEGWDRDELRLDKGGEELIKRIESACSGPVVVVMHIGGQVVMEDWIDLPKIDAVLFAGYPGQETGNALVDILWGDVNPSGKLPFTMGKHASDWPAGNIVRDMSSLDDSHPRAIFSEGLAIDYKWFDKYDITPRFEFGHGLSYSTFEMCDLRVEKRYQSVQDTIQQTNEKFDGDGDLYDVLYVARANVTNTGKVDGAEVAQLYMAFPRSEVEQPPRHLKGYAKPYLSVSEMRTVYFPLRRKDLSVWDVERQLWTIPKGNFTFWAGSSSRILPLKQTLEIDPSVG